MFLHVEAVTEVLSYSYYSYRLCNGKWLDFLTPVCSCFINYILAIVTTHLTANCKTKECYLYIDTKLLHELHRVEEQHPI